MTLQPGSALWLVRHELRLYWRSGPQIGSVTFLIIALALLHLIALGIALATQMPSARPLPPAFALVGITAGLGFALLLMTSRALSAAIQALYTRGDLDLLLSSPLAPNTIVAVRAAAIAVNVTGELALLLWPFANVFVLFGRFAWFKAYIILPSIGLLATSLALVLMIALFRLLGPRRTRVVVQIAAAVLGMSFVILWQLPNALRRGEGQGARTNVIRDLGADVSGPLWLPAKQVLNGILPTVLFAIAAVALLVFTVRWARNRFIDASTLVAGVSRGTTSRVATGALRFRSGLRRVLVTKELRLIARDPWLLTQLLGQFVFLVPGALLLWRRGAQSGLPWAWLAVVFVVGSVGSALSWLTVSAEDSPELLASSPVATSTIVRAKIEAALLPAVPLVIAPIAVLWPSYPVFGLSIAVCSAGAAISCGLLQIRNPVARRRADFKTRHKGRGLSGLIEVTVIAMWVGLCFAITHFIYP